ncbi:alpha/beta fold hydrolase [Nocardia sp. NPDC059240]|uniref:alpha/beta fold hydrolase n=1 Tax=Nocardia sp. NPDC059240 TaxID=3346786 RepID=UPI00367E7450
MLGLLLIALVVVVGAPVLGVLGYRQVKRVINAKRLRITDPRGVDESGFVRIGGLAQWISIRGDNRDNPVIVEIQGGPGASNLVFMTRTRGWERDFTIVRWDVRGSGKTFAAAPGNQGEMNLDQIYRDALEVIDNVRRRMGVDRVLLVANSFGTNIGLRLARNHPELFHAYVGTDQNINAGGRERSAYEAMVARLRAQGKKKELAEAEAMGPDKSTWTPEQWSKYNKFVITSDPLSFDTMKTVVIRSLWFSPLHSLRGLRLYLKGMTFSEQMGTQAVIIDEWAEGLTFRLPMFVFQGDSDALTPPSPARAYVDAINAPLKDFALIHEASHFAGFRHPDQFQHLLLTKVRPLIAGETAHP